MKNTTTCVVGLVQDGNIYLGADSAGTDGHLNQEFRADEKVFTNGQFVLGGTSSFRMLQLLRYKFEPPKQSQNQSDMKYMVSDFIDAVLKCFKDNNYGKEKEGIMEGGSFLVGYNGQLYSIYEDFQVSLSTTNYNAVGCGAGFALGSMFSSKGKKPKERLKLALEAASFHSAGVSPPFNYVELLKNKK